MKVYAIESSGETDWVVAENEESAKQCLIDLCSDYEEFFKEDGVDISVLTDAEIDELSFTDTDSDIENAPDLKARDLMANAEEIPFHLAGTVY